MKSFSRVNSVLIVEVVESMQASGIVVVVAQQLMYNSEGWASKSLRYTRKLMIGTTDPTLPYS